MTSRLATLFVMSLTVAACSSRAARPVVAASGEHGPVIEVENQNVQGMEVTFDLGGQQYLLGNVPAFGVGRFSLPVEVTGAAARITLKATGDLMIYRTPMVRYSGAEDLRLIITADPRQSALKVW